MANKALSPTALRPTVENLTASFLRSLRAENKSERTVETYGDAVRLFGFFLARQGMPAEVAQLRREHVEAFIHDLLKRWKPATANNRYRALQQFFKWLLEEGEIRASPMANMRPPIVPEEPPPVMTEDQLRRLLKACEGNTFDARRDKAIILLLLDTGMRRAELAGLKYDDLDLDNSVAVVLGKGRKPRGCPFGRKTAVALDRYLRVRATHRAAALPSLWLGHAGPMGGAGVADVVRKRGEKAGLPGIHPHLFRHSFAHSWLSSGGQEVDLMMLTGWRSRTMLSRYGAAAAADRAREAYRRLSPGDRL